MMSFNCQEGPQRMRLSPLSVIVVAALAAVIGVVVFLLVEQPMDEPHRPQPVAAPEHAAKPGAQARALIAQIKAQGVNPDLDAVFARAEQFVASGELTEAHLLLFFAARKAHAPSARVLGGMSDPMHHSQTSSIMDKPDFVQAHKWYKQAAGAGDQVAKLRLDVLKLWVERAAQQGNEQARQLLTQW